MSTIWIIRLIFGVIIFLLIFGKPLARASRGINTGNWYLPAWATILLLAILVVGLIWFFGGFAAIEKWWNSPPDSAGKRPIVTAPIEGAIELQPGETTIAWLAPGPVGTGSGTSVTGGCVSYFFGSNNQGQDCPGTTTETSSWANWPQGKYTVKNISGSKVTYRWWDYTPR